MSESKRTHKKKVNKCKKLPPDKIRDDSLKCFRLRFDTKGLEGNLLPQTIWSRICSTAIFWTAGCCWEPDPTNQTKEFSLCAACFHISLTFPNWIPAFAPRLYVPAWPCILKARCQIYYGQCKCGLRGSLNREISFEIRLKGEARPPALSVFYECVSLSCLDVKSSLIRRYGGSWQTGTFHLNLFCHTQGWVGGGGPYLWLRAGRFFVWSTYTVNLSQTADSSGGGEQSGL